MNRMSRRMRAAMGIAVGVAVLAGAGCSPPGQGSSNMADDVDAVSSWTSDIPSSVPLAPDPEAGVNSFSYSAVQEVSHTSHATLKVGCPNGFYVRPGGGDIWGDDTPEPLDKTFVGNTVLMQQTQGDQLLYQYSGTPPGVALYQGIEEGYWNAGTSTHHFTLTFWCDRLATVNVTPPANATQDATPGRPARQASPSPKSSPTLGGDDSAFDAVLQNASTGEYLSGGNAGDTAEMSSGPTTMYVAGDQEGNSNDVYNAFAYGLWSEAGGNQSDGPNLGFDGAAATWFGPSDGIANGGLLLPVQANAPGSAMLVQAAASPSRTMEISTTKRSGRVASASRPPTAVGGRPCWNRATRPTRTSTGTSTRPDTPIDAIDLPALERQRPGPPSTTSPGHRRAARFGRTLLHSIRPALSEALKVGLAGRSRGATGFTPSVSSSATCSTTVHGDVWTVGDADGRT